MAGCQAAKKSPLQRVSCVAGPAALWFGVCSPCRRRDSRRKQSTMVEIINLGSLQLRFLQSKDDTAGSLDMFEMTLQPNARMPIPHYHESWDETIYGLTGTTTWRVDGKRYRPDAGRNRLHQTRHRARFYQSNVGAGDMSLHAQSGCGWSAVLQGNGSLAGGRRTRSGQDEANDVALRADTRAVDVLRARSGLSRREHREPLARISQIERIGIGGLFLHRFDPRRHRAAPA